MMMAIRENNREVNKKVLTNLPMIKRSIIFNRENIISIKASKLLKLCNYSNRKLKVLLRHSVKWLFSIPHNCQLRFEFWLFLPNEEKN